MTERDSAIALALKYEIRSAKYEANSKDKTRMFETVKPPIKLALKADLNDLARLWEVHVILTEGKNLWLLQNPSQGSG
jgi:hypothetical protein